MMVHFGVGFIGLASGLLFRNLFLHAPVNFETTILRHYPSKRLQRLRSRLEQNGESASTVQQFIRNEVWAAAEGSLCAVVAWMLGLSPLCLLTFPPLAFAIPSLLLARQGRHRKRQIVLALPGYLDLLTLALEAGLDLVAALQEILEHDGSHPLRDELKLTIRSIQMGTPRSRAFMRLSQRTGLRPLSHLAAAIAQGEELGASIGDLLRLQSRSIRQNICREAETRAARAPLRMLIPLAGLIFPAAMLLLFAPIGIRLFSGP